MFKVINREAGREKRHWRIRKRVTGTMEQPRLSVYRSNQHIYVQLIDDIQQKTLISFCTLSKEFKGASAKGGNGNIEAAKKLGELAAQTFKSKGYKRIVFDRSGYLYHGRIKALADALRAGGLQF